MRQQGAVKLSGSGAQAGFPAEAERDAEPHLELVEVVPFPFRTPLRRFFGKLLAPI
jgi:hypothetical protein